MVQQFKLDLGFGYIQVYVWQHREQLIANVITDEENVVACYVPVPHRESPPKDLFGEFHFVDDEVTIRHVAHEMTHLTLDLYQFFDDELVAHMVGDAFETCMVEIFGIDYL
jgi:hypothetical protein